MKTIIAGGRDFVPTDTDWKVLDEFKTMLPITEVVCGMAKGADTFGREWAKSQGIPVKEFPADWDRYGRNAGSIRNNQMADYSDALVVFPGGRGTAHMTNSAILRDLKIEKVGRMLK